MQNEPNYESKHSSPTSPNAPRVMDHERRVTKYAKRTQFLTQRTRNTVYAIRNTKICKTNPIYRKNELKSMYIKGLQKYSTRNTRHERSLPDVFVAGKYAKQTQFSNIETRDQRRETRICKTNPIYMIKCT
jgi:hypothetical protein